MPFTKFIQNYHVRVTQIIEQVRLVRSIENLAANSLLLCKFSYPYKLSLKTRKIFYL